MKRFPPALLLFFLAPVIGELLSGSSPPAEFFHPFGLIVLSALYGGGALLIRELTLRWGKGWPTILVLGMAYGILEEGVMVKSFFDPNWPDLGLLGLYGRWAGVNWIWSVFLTVYHAFISIAIPIFLVEMMVPDRRDKRWLGDRGLLGITLLLLADVLFGALVLTPYRPPAGLYMLTLVLVAALVLAARRMPPRWFRQQAETASRPLSLGLLGFAATLALFFIHWVLPEINLPVILTLASLLLLGAGFYLALRRLSGCGTWNDEHRLALASGALTFFILLAPLQELDPARNDNPAGMTLVGLAALLLLLWLRARTRRRLHRHTADLPTS